MNHRSNICLLILLLTASCTGSPKPSTSVLVDEYVQPTIASPLTEQPMDTLSPATVSSLPEVSKSTSQSLDDARWAIYHPDPQHLWNQLFRQFFRRTTSEGREYGWDATDPLLWPDTTHLFQGDTHQQTIQLLEEFFATNGETFIHDPLKRAMLQRDLWAVFDWLGLRADYVEQRQALQGRVAQIMHRLALTEEEIALLPDNYAATVSSGAFPSSFQHEDPRVPFLPADLLAPDSEWVSVGRKGGPIAMAHTARFPFYGRSVFLVFVKVSGGREATLSFLRKLNTETSPSLPDGLAVALVRQGLLIDQQGSLRLSPVVEMVQLRQIDQLQKFYNFGLHRKSLFAEVSDGLQPVDKEIPLFGSHGFDLFALNQVVEVEMPNMCIGCHSEIRQGIDGVTSILSYSRARFPLPDEERPILIATTPEDEAKAVITWKSEQESWQWLRKLWLSAARHN